MLHGASYRLLNLDGIDIEAPLERDLIYLRNKDVPGVIGQVGTILGAHNVNIANFALGRGEKTAAGTEAIAVVHIDSEAPAAAIEGLTGISAVTDVRRVRLF